MVGAHTLIPMPVESLFARLEPVLPQVSKPIQYVGGELGAVVKPWDEAAVFASVARTHRAVVVHEAVAGGGGALVAVGAGVEVVGVAVGGGIVGVAVGVAGSGRPRCGPLARRAVA